MSTRSDSKVWQDVGGGPRPSHVLMLGAVLLAAGPTLATLQTDAMFPWWIWLSGLAVTGTALLMCTPRPWASAMVSLAGLLFLTQAGCLAAGLSGLAPAARAYNLLAVPKVLSLALLAYTERHEHGRPRLVWLAVAGLLGAAKVGWRALASDLPYREFLDLSVALVVALALWIFARGLHRREDHWARRRQAETGATFDDFNRIQTG